MGTGVEGMAELPSGTVTFLFTDIEGSTARWEGAPDAMRGEGDQDADQDSGGAEADLARPGGEAKHDGHCRTSPFDGARCPAHSALAD